MLPTKVERKTGGELLACASLYVRAWAGCVKGERLLCHWFGVMGEIRQSYQTTTAGGNSRNDMVFHSNRHWRWNATKRCRTLASGWLLSSLKCQSPTLPNWWFITAKPCNIATGNCARRRPNFCERNYRQCSRLPVR